MIDGRPGAFLPPVDFDKLKADLVDKHGDTIKDTDVMSAALYPKVFDEYAEFRAKYGPVDKLDTRTFLAGPEIEEEINVSVRQSFASICIVITIDLSSCQLLCCATSCT